jgi:hypothetical protein
MLRVLDHEFHVAGLGHGTAVQHDDIVADLIGCRQVVGDADDGNAAFMEGRSLSMASEKSSRATVEYRSRIPPPKIFVTWRASSSGVIMSLYSMWHAAQAWGRASLKSGSCV